MGERSTNPSLFGQVLLERADDPFGANDGTERTTAVVGREADIPLGYPLLN
jgi:hypothetical protein